MFGSHFLRKIKQRRIHLSSKGDVEIQELFLDKLAKKKEVELGITERKREVPLSRRLIQGLFLFIVVLILGLFVKTFQLQIINHEEYIALAEENKFIAYSTQAIRGVIYDTNGQQLVFNKPSFNLVLNKNQLPDSEKERTLKEISFILEEDIENIKQRINDSKTNPVIVSENLAHNKLIIFETRMSEFPGFKTQKSAAREYVDGETFSHIIGYIGKISSEEYEEDPSHGFDYIGKVGIEKVYEDVLRKNPGKVLIERDALGNELSKEITFLPESGNSLVLWIDADLQRKIQESLKETMERLGIKKAVAIAMNPKTGGIMALVSIPGYDNNLFNKDANPEDLNNLLESKDNPLFNRAISGKYATGSIIKPFVGLAALEEKLISADKSLNCKGKITIPHRYDPEIEYEYHDLKIHSYTDIRKALAESCNVYFYTIGGGYEDQKGLGPANIKKYLEFFGWNDKTGIDLPNEIKGFIPSPEWKKETKNEGWWDGDTYNFSIGQGDVMITPIEVITAYAAIANGGTLYKPKIVREIVDMGKNLIEKIEPEIVKKDFVSSQNLQVIKEGMRMAVTGEGAPQASCLLLNSLSTPVAAKTGTAQTPIADHFNNWISVFGPYEDPEIVITIMFEGVQGIQSATVPTAKNILEWYFNR